MSEKRVVPETEESIPLSEADKAKAKAYVESKMLGALVCPVCKNQGWCVSDSLLWLMPMSSSSVLSFSSKEIYPQLPIICTTCGYTFFMNAVMAGLVAPSSASNTVSITTGSEANNG